LIHGIGTDLVVVARLGEFWQRHGERALEKLLAPAEREDCRTSSDPARFLAKRFAAKEALGKALGLDRDRLLAVLTGGAANSWFLEKRGATMWNGSFSVGFKQALLLKDLRIVRQLEASAGTGHSVVDRALEHYAALVDAGHGDDDISGLIRLKHRR